VQFRVIDISNRLIVDAYQLTELRVAIAQLIAKNVVEECIKVHDQFVSPYFHVPKPNGFNRFIIDLKELNKTPHISKWKTLDR